MWQPRGRQLAAIKTVLFALCFVPFAHLVWGVAYDTLGANPVEAVTHSTGWWTLFLLCATLGVTPLRRATGANWLLKLRRMLGLFAFFYVVLHFLTYVWLDQWFDVAAIAKDVLKRPYITIGFTAFLLLIPLAATSTDAMQRRLGRNWQRVHRFIYLIAAFGVLHFWWLVKRDVTEPALFALALAGLLGVRLYWFVRRRARAMRPAVATSGG
ncbi:MAG: protein-methionine-sulfoxide reductase heme-binding subunit MsrQ [Burkholderiales bacterium]